MKKFVLWICSVALSAGPAFAASCFIAKENNKVLQSQGDCTTSYPPQSSFKIALSLIGFDSKILKVPSKPLWSLPKGVDPYITVCKDNHDPRTWMRDSCLWYSRLLTIKLGMEKFKKYVAMFAYGNQDLSGDKGKDNGLTNAWLSSSLEISPKEMVVFLEKLVSNKLPFSKHAHSMTRNIMYVEDLPCGWKLYGKTGSGSLLTKDRTQKTDIKHGWFIGWIEKGEKKIIFVNHIVDDKKEEKHAGPRAKEQAKEKLMRLIEEIKNSNKGKK
jgi:beta-lactamase class D